MQKIALLIIFILCTSTATALTRINEIMYNPEGLDNNREFIELYSDEFVNFSGYIIADKNLNDSLKALKYSETNYALVVEENFDFSETDASVYSAGASIGNNLDNEGEEIFLYSPPGELVDFVSYNGDLANGNGKSLEFFNGEWFESAEKEGSPGRENYVEIEEKENIEEISTGKEEAVQGINGAVYESNTTKARNFGLYLLLFLSMLINIVLIWRR